MNGVCHRDIKPNNILCDSGFFFKKNEIKIRGNQY